MQQLENTEFNFDFGEDIFVSSTQKFKMPVQYYVPRLSEKHWFLKEDTFEALEARINYLYLIGRKDEIPRILQKKQVMLNIGEKKSLEIQALCMLNSKLPIDDEALTCLQSSNEVSSKYVADKANAAADVFYIFKRFDGPRN